jgi:hypothetical protein
MTIAETIAKLTDDQAANCLQCILKGYAEREQQLTEVITTDAPKAMAAIAVELLDDAGRKQLAGVNANDPLLVRQILQLMASDKSFGEQLEGGLGRRKTLIEPVTTALVMAGLIILLSTHVKISYENKNGEKNLKVSVDKPSAPKELIKKVLGVLA